MLEYVQSKLALAYRTRLTDYVQREYFSAKTYYTLGNLECGSSSPLRDFVHDG